MEVVYSDLVAGGRRAVLLTGASTDSPSHREAPRLRFGGVGLRSARFALPRVPLFGASVLSAAVCDALPGRCFRARDSSGGRLALESVSRLSRRASRGIAAVRRVLAFGAGSFDVVVHASTRLGDVYDRLQRAGGVLYLLAPAGDHANARRGRENGSCEVAALSRRDFLLRLFDSPNDRYMGA